MRQRYAAFLSVLSLLSVINIVIFSSRPGASPKRQYDVAIVQRLVQNSPVLWRSWANESEAASVGVKLKAQRDWILRLSETPFLKTLSRPKSILIEEPTGSFYHTNGSINCPYAPSFANACKLVRISPLRWAPDPWKYAGLEGDILVSVRDWDSRSNWKLPSSIRQQLLYILEPPTIAQDAELSDNVLLASYWRGSDIPIPYGYWEEEESQGNVLLLHPPPPTQIVDEETLLMIKGKRRMVAGVVSNCRARGRLDAIAELSRWVELDVYGKCGNLSCGDSPDCFSRIERDYKFILAWENSECEDYITEKLYVNALSHYIVPIVMGARPIDYNTLAPPHSYIHVEQFPSLQSLGKFLNELGSPQGLAQYLEYFRWKEVGGARGRVVGTRETLGDFFCRVCGLLYYGDVVKAAPKWGRGGHLSPLKYGEEGVGGKCLSGRGTRWDPTYPSA